LRYDGTTKRGVDGGLSLSSLDVIGSTTFSTASLSQLTVSHARSHVGVCLAGRRNIKLLVKSETRKVTSLPHVLPHQAVALSHLPTSNTRIRRGYALTLTQVRVALSSLTKVPLGIATAQPLGDTAQCAHALSDVGCPVLLGVADRKLSSRRFIHSDTRKLLLPPLVLVSHEPVELIHLLGLLSADLTLL